jgi:hypothetical protein
MCERRSPELAAAGVVYIAARPPQIKTLEQQEVLISPALPQGTTLNLSRGTGENEVIAGGVDSPFVFSLFIA